jgi:hypothetical protein
MVEGENLRVEGMADAHECVMVAYGKALDALDFMSEVFEEFGGMSENYEKLQFARSVLAVMLEAFDDEYYRVIEGLKNVEV